ncbi:uncharacterized protein [Littorina saxatilis]|uniref:uncharacterized protein n=1 Tax=Littorina saxatilis TaxID=31220 RepID=UPI0038B60EB8
MSQDDLKFMKIVKENVKVNEAGHYEMPLPFRPEKPSLPDNRGAAVKHLKGLKRQFKKRRGYRDDCVKFMTLILYGLIVTCFASRAIHIETLDDMSSDSFINALRIVVSMRGNISRIWCDKGTNFVGACNEFKFNPPAASHMGGVWERQIRTIRSILNGLLRRSGQRLTTSSLRTFLYEVMAIVNSRPLSVESLESADGPRPLTPNHVLTMKSGAILPPPGVFEDPDLYARKRWRCVQRMADEFWLLWKSQYLTLLQKRRVWQRPQANVQVGDVLHDQNLCRSEWCMARVIEVMPGSDGLVRRVKVHVGTKALDNHGRPTGDSRILERPIHKMT